MDNNLDYIVKSVLSNEVKELSNTEDIFHRIEEEIKIKVFKRSKDYEHYTKGFGHKKYISIAACFLIICITLMFASSYQARAFAEQVISSLKTIFTVEIEGNKLQIVEKPTNEANFTNSVSRTTQKSDEELGDKLGFSIRFPKKLGDSFRLDSKSLGVVLRKEVDYETGATLEKDMFNAIEDDNALLQLKPYNAIRDVSGSYKKPDQSTIFIGISQAWKPSEIESQMKKLESLQGIEFKKVKVGDLDGFWAKLPSPDYPIKIENDIGKADMSVQPNIKMIYTLTWRKSDITYILNTFNDFKLSLEESIKIAEDFMKVN